jgi:hypothetical protein
MYVEDMIRRTAVGPTAKGAAAIVVIAALLAGLTGCDGVSAGGAGYATASTKPADVTGVWVNNNATLNLKADGTFVLTDVPEYTSFISTRSWKSGDLPTRSDAGQWSVESDVVRLDSQEGGGADKIYYGGQGSELTLEYGLDLGSNDPRCFEFVRKDSHLTARRPDRCFIQP